MVVVPPRRRVPPAQSVTAKATALPRASPFALVDELVVLMSRRRVPGPARPQPHQEGGAGSASPQRDWDGNEARRMARRQRRSLRLQGRSRLVN